MKMARTGAMLANQVTSMAASGSSIRTFPHGPLAREIGQPLTMIRRAINDIYFFILLKLYLYNKCDLFSVLFCCFWKLNETIISLHQRRSIPDSDWLSIVINNGTDALMTKIDDHAE